MTAARNLPVLEPLRTVLRAAGWTPAAVEVTAIPWATDGAVYRLLDAGGRRWALRVRPRDRIANFESEQTAMRLAAEAGVPVPEVLRPGIAGVWSYMVCAWAEGAPLGQVVSERPELAERLGAAMGELQSRLHRCPPPGGPGPWLDPAEGEERRLFALAAAEPLSECLLHLDFHGQNLLWHDGRISAVLDWANVGGGDPRLDVARTRALFAVARAARLAGEAALVRAETAWRNAYEHERGALTNMEPFVRWAALRTVRDLRGKLAPAALEEVWREAARAW